MQIKAIVGLALAAAAGLPALAAPPKAAETTYVDPTDGYSISYPSTWQFKPPNADGRIFVTSQPDGPQDMFRENLNLAPRPLNDPTFSIKGQCVAFSANFAKDYEGYTPGKCEDLRWNGVDAMRLDYSFDKSDNGVARRIHVLQTLAIKKGKLYVVTFTAIEATYTRYTPIASRMIASIKIP